ncbi:unnamed protein product [Cochlearia groenlandica]
MRFICGDLQQTGVNLFLYHGGGGDEKHMCDRSGVIRIFSVTEWKEMMLCSVFATPVTGGFVFGEIRDLRGSGASTSSTFAIRVNMSPVYSG